MSCSKRGARRRLSVAAVGLLLVGCAAAYEPRRPFSMHGFSDERLGVRTWIVRVGNGWPNEQPRLTLFALYRAAEITTAHGFRYFEVLEGSDNIADPGVYAPDAVVPDAIERDQAHDPTWAQHYLNWTEHTRRRVGRVRFRVLAPEELPLHDRALDAEKVLARLRRVVAR
jgi:hypothetical protein